MNRFLTKKQRCSQVGVCPRAFFSSLLLGTNVWSAVAMLQNQDRKNEFDFHSKNNIGIPQTTTEYDITNQFFKMTPSSSMDAYRKNPNANTLDSMTNTYEYRYGKGRMPPQATSINDVITRTITIIMSSIDVIEFACCNKSVLFADAAAPIRFVMSKV